MEKSERLEGKCPLCPKVQLVRADGLVRNHNLEGHRSPTCPGSMSKPEWTRPFTGAKKRVKIKN